MPRFFVDPDISKARTIATDFYTDPACFDEAREKIFAASWQFIGDDGLVKTPGQCYPFTMLDDYLNEPLLLTRE